MIGFLLIFLSKAVNRKTCMDWLERWISMDVQWNGTCNNSILSCIWKHNVVWTCEVELPNYNVVSWSLQTLGYVLELLVKGI